MADVIDTTRATLHRLSTSCPRCGAHPALRLSDEVVQALQSLPATARLGTYQCQRRGCGAVYDLFAPAAEAAGVHLDRLAERGR